MEKKQRARVPVFPSARWTFAIMNCMGTVFVYALRINLSVAIVCMLRDPVQNASALSYNTSYSRNISYQSNDTSTLVVNIDECGTLENIKAGKTEGEFDWSRKTRSLILSSFFIGYIVTQIPGGWLASRFGGKHVHGTGVLVTAVATLLVPIAARATPYLVVVLRAIMGLGTGVSFPAITALAGRWAPPNERSRIITVSFSGTMIGNIVTLAVSGLLCSVKYDNGWPLIFYVFGGGALVWWLFWNLLVFNGPSEHPRISEVEKRYITNAIGRKADGSQTKIPVPWLSIITSPRVWAIFVAHTCNNVGNYTLLTSLPQYMSDVLKFNIKTNGALSALPYVAMFLTSIIGGQVADFLIKRKVFSVGVVRKIFQATGYVGISVFMIGLSFVDCTQRALAVCLLVISVSFTFGCRSGFNCSPVDIAPRFAGIIFGISNTLSTIPGIVMPLIIGALTTNGTREEWQRVFYIVAAAYCFGAIVYVLLASGEVQKWALAENRETRETDIKPEDQDLL